MSDRKPYRILHPTDNSNDSREAFAHALAFASRLPGHLTVLHVDDEEAHLSDLPGVRDLLVKWKKLKSYDDAEGLDDIGIGVKKVIAEGDDPASTTLTYLEEHPKDLVVLGTHQDRGWKRWTRSQVAEPIARGARKNALFVPSDSKGFVDPSTGDIKLDRVLIPVTADPDAGKGVAALVELVDRLDIDPPSVMLLHVADGHRSPARDLSFPDSWDITALDVEGDVVEKVLDAAADYKVDLLLMVTKGHDGVLDLLRGSNTEQVLRKAGMAVMAVPDSE